MIRLSFIVPFYNVEPYIEECIRSLYAQDILWEEYEVICVDDCSPDDCRNIIEKLQTEFPTLKLVCHEKNKKQGGARNTGLKAAQGKYIWFVDSDDYIYPNVLRLLLESAEKNEVDIIQFDYTRDGESIAKNRQLGKFITGEAYLFNNISQDWFYKIVGAWRQLFSRDFLETNQLRYIEGAMYEDTDYLLHAFLLADKVQHISIDAYHYRINNESVTIAPISPIKLAWRVNQLVRCSQLIKLTKSSIARKTIQEMVANSLSLLRKETKNFSLSQKHEYIKYLTPTIKYCRPFMSWRTWLAIKYAITWFI